ncbi:MAG: hypothetical protein PF630_11940, partial [Gammaproteobacteria bacterium]|nr:hypothetical protein [Gammaproteobacteria bacterium]
MNGVIVHYEKWELGALRDKIPRNNSTRNQLLNQIRSVDRTKKIVNYHIFKAQEAFDIDQLFTNNTNAADEIMRYLLGCGSNQEKFELDRIAIEANIIGAIFHTRSLWDHFAQLVNTLLLENDIDVHSVTIRGVLDRRNNCHQKCVT